MGRDTGMAIVTRITADLVEVHIGMCDNRNHRKRKLADEMISMAPGTFTDPPPQDEE